MALCLFCRPSQSSGSSIIHGINSIRIRYLRALTNGLNFTYTLTGVRCCRSVKGYAVRVIRCPFCQEPLPGTANFCARCGEYLLAHAQYLDTIKNNLVVPRAKKAGRPAALKVSRFFAVDPDASATTQRLAPRMSTTPVQSIQNGHGSGSSVISLTPDDVSQEQDSDVEVQRRGTWEKIVTYKTPRVPPQVVTPPSLPAVSAPPAGSTPPALIRVRKTPLKKPPRVPTQLFSWVSILVLIGLLLGGVFGLVVTFSRGNLAQSSHSKGAYSLQVTPSTVALNGYITLRGSGFSPSVRVGLTRDINTAVIDTVGANIIRADAQGSFSDTVLVDASWRAGSHVIRAEDAITHKSASFTVTVTGHSASLSPAHLLFSTNVLDLGSGDQATNSTQAITLSNAGGGSITWQATAPQPWLLISPKSGTFSNDQIMQVVVAADRSNLHIGSYSARIYFTWST